MAEHAPSAARGWIVTLAALGINLVLGALYAWSVVAQALKAKGWSQTEANLPFAVATATFACTMIFAGRVQDKLGPRRITVLGGLTLGGAMIVSAFTTTPLFMCLTFGVIGGIGIGLGYAATTPASIKWFSPARKGLITGIVVAGIALASVYMAPLTRYLLTFMTLSNTLLTLGIGTAVVVPALAVLLVNPPAGYVPPTAGGGPQKKRPVVMRPDRDWNEVLKTPQFYLLWVTFILAASPGLMILVNAVNIATLKGHKDAGIIAVMLLGVFNMVGRILSGVVSDRIGRTNTMVLAFVFQAANMFCFASYQSAEMIVFGAAFTGLCYGGIFTLMPAAMADFFGIKNLGVNFGLLFTAFGVAGCTGALLGGKVSDIFGSYDRAYVAVGIALLGATLLGVLTRPPRTPAQPLLVSLEGVRKEEGAGR